MKIKIITCVFLLLVSNIFLNQVFAKYVIVENIEVGTIKIDRTNPTLNVSYSCKNVTSENVEVTIKADEQIGKIEGWTLQEDKKTLKKSYTKDTNEEIEIEDISGNVTKTTININNIDKEAPRVTIEKITNSNTKYPNYANKNATITCNIIIEDNKKIEESLDKSDIKILVNKKEINPSKKLITVKEDTQTKKTLLLTISGIEEEGNLVIRIAKNSVKDEVGLSNETIEKDTKIQIDNTKPKVTFTENEVEQGKVEGIILANERIKILDGWTKDSDIKLKKVFSSNISYNTIVEDFANNKSEIEINVTKATNIVFSYASHNSNIGWSLRLWEL